MGVFAQIPLLNGRCDEYGPFFAALLLLYEIAPLLYLTHRFPDIVVSIARDHVGKSANYV